METSIFLLPLWTAAMTIKSSSSLLVLDAPMISKSTSIGLRLKTLHLNEFFIALYKTKTNF